MSCMEFLSSSSKAVLGKGNGPEYKDPKLWIGLVGVLLVWVMKSQKSWREHVTQEVLIMAYVLAIDLLVLHIEQYTNHFILYPMVLVLVYEFELHGAGLVRKWLWPQSDSYSSLQASIVGGGGGGLQAVPSSMLGPRGGHSSMLNNSGSLAPNSSGDVQELKATNVFMDLERPLLRVMCVFVGQVVLMLFYMHALGKQLRSTRSGDFKYDYWVAAVLAVQFGALFGSSSSAQFGNYFEHFSSWLHVFRRNIYVQGEGIGGDMVFYKVDVSLADKAVRSVMSFVVNAVFRDFIMFTVPIFLMLAEGPMDVFKDALAVMFLTTIDDVPEKLYVLTRTSVKEPTYAAKRTMEYTETHTFLDAGESQIQKGAEEYPEVIQELRRERRNCSGPVCAVM